MGVVRGSFVAVFVMYIVVITTALKAEAALNCGQVTSTLAPCLGYLRSGGPTVPLPCCNGVRTLYGAAQTTPDRRTVCGCLKQTANAMTGSIDLNAAAGLPSKCRVNIPYKISPSTDCSKVV